MKLLKSLAVLLVPWLVFAVWLALAVCAALLAWRVQR